MSQEARDINAAHQRYRESLDLSAEAQIDALVNLHNVVGRIRREQINEWTREEFKAAR